MRVYIGAALLVVFVVGGAWLVLALTFSHSSGGADALTRSATCVRNHPSLASDPTEAARFKSPGLRPLGIRWRQVRAVALFADSLSPDSVDKEDARIMSTLTSKGVSNAAISNRLLHEDNLSLYYLTGTPSQAAQNRDRPMCLPRPLQPNRLRPRALYLPARRAPLPTRQTPTRLTQLHNRPRATSQRDCHTASTAASTSPAVYETL
jgi:hypothetical protein